MADFLTITLNPALDVSGETAQVQAVHKLRCGSVQRHPGGGGINVARVLHRLGSDCTAICMLGGPNGELLAQLLSEEGVHYVPVAIGGHTRESFTVLETSTKREYRFVIDGPQMHEQDWKACLSLLDWQPPAQYLVVSGSLPPGAPVSVYTELGNIAQRWGSHFVMDGSGPALHAALGPEVFLLKPSLREFRELTGLPLPSLSDVQATAQAWVADKKCQVLVVSLGAHGALMVSGDTVAYAPALPLAVVGAVGAGDSFVAGMLWALTNGHSLTEAFLHGVAAGSASLLSSGTQLCSAEGLFTWLPHVQCFDRAPDVLV